MLIPKKVKHRKCHKARGRGKTHLATSLVNLDFGDYGIKAMSGGWVSSRQLEAARRAMVRYIKRGGKIWVRIFPNRPVTSKGTHFTMGSGKGSPEYYVAVVHPGMVLFEMSGVTKELANEALRRASHKLPLKTKMISQEE
ncbi:50S ribosomal protein L16 [Candidatus Falkowbacteria bacterium RIFOXYD2_FULL_35_9]|uniref:Large ribosomal subunit protein uL16 n=1 Tax=Candidatus Falkowbacteria bacterium RIFOXYC2_FULL_36_12 TaxID=1798002 RepID=A0A1F5SW69_9BACT|nr:MAG: 50S ribosomal protein L16 [Candidatus Falkowbacteria bacterium RIFOXYB2_FULL_35_7]OGF30974.1 MAG: 50S ribosomal protein L16 [Candidatus Falkowbacteria bacterium RIFOXYC2_FULL_36_12]OGF34402.1 MAG: 50S ribosomal protein L16 [Candidatus Falkowbacteria bacterium RIFOXYA2_FULL_35_8]OGF47299.1 MAG: 50S ribosomal protein L16 [Candidatus Falkowbacteria bacterium RIFOXYD2_FULL_35_9]